MEYVAEGVFKSSVSDKKMHSIDQINITNILKQIHSAKEKSESILKKLVIENIDLCNICATLSEDSI